ncbi:hypothetical protein [Alicyclobacillus sendaiensis]|uniref:hypothetical protein n=1 Tax=Alicyclobacillus sendaiensis TaxID=192387 RepID=UPI0026F44701|nr:hypothetical protein [Alicyclobacillus sendaiensis]
MSGLPGYDRWRLMTPEEAMPWAYEWPEDDEDQGEQMTCWSCGEDLDEDTAVPDGSFWLCPECAKLPVLDEEEEVTESDGVTDGSTLDCA